MVNDEKIIELLFARDEAGLKYTSEKYDCLYRKVLSQALTDQLDIDECANDVLMSIWNSIPPHRPIQFPAYICQIARRIGINRYKYNTSQKRNLQCTILISELEDCIPASNRAEDRLETKQAQQMINAFLRELPDQTRILFIRRYFLMESIQQIAERYAVSKNFVTVRLHRARNSLRKYLEKEREEQ